MNPLLFEADITSGMDQLREQFPTAPLLPFDDELFDYGLDKARDHNRLPARVLADAFKTAIVGDHRTADDYGLPMQKTTQVEDDDEPVQLSQEQEDFIRTVAGLHADAAWPSVRGSLTKAFAQPQPLAKRSKAFCGDPDLANLDTHPEKGRKVLSVERDGRLKTTHYEDGIHVMEIVE
jgi:hypothetical protein